MERMDEPKGYILPDKAAVEQILAVEAELLRSEGIDPAWPGFADARIRTADKR
jgi:hypothetical protein